MLRFDNGAWTPVVPELIAMLEDNGESDWIDAVVADDGRGHGWVGVSAYRVDGGLFRIEDDVATRVRIGYGNEGQINTIAWAPDGELWVGMGGVRYAQQGPFGGLAAFDGQSWRYYAMAEGLAHPHVTSIAFGPGGVVWAGTEAGLTRFEPGQRYGRSFTTGNSAIAGDYLTAVATDAGGTAWIGTQRGLSRFDEERWSTYGISETGLPHNRVNDLLVDAQNRVWVATDGGLSILNPDEATAVTTEPYVPSPDAAELYPSYPNPFNGRTVIRFAQPRAGQVRLAVFDVLGRHVRTLASGRLNAGSHRTTWDGLDDRGREVGSGVYFVMLRADQVVRQQRLCLMK